jgi:hypothetical protein
MTYIHIQIHLNITAIDCQSKILESNLYFILHTEFKPTRLSAKRLIPLWFIFRQLTSKKEKFINIDKNLSNGRIILKISTSDPIEDEEEQLLNVDMKL